MVHQSSNRTPDHQSVGDVITSGRTSSGSRRSAAQLGDRDVIRVAGGETSVAAAINAGLVDRMADGSLVVIYDASQPAPSADPFEHSGRGPEARTRSSDPLSDNADHLEPMLEGMEDQSVETLINAVAQQGEQMAVANIILDVTKGADASDAALGTIASGLGIEPEEARAQYDQIKAGFVAQAEARVAADSGLDPEAVFAWAREAEPKLLGEAIKGHLHERSTHGYSKVVNAYYLNLDTIDPEGLMRALENNGFTKVTRTSKGKILFSDESGESEWRAAVRAGVIKPGGKLQRKSPLAASR